MTDQRGSDSRRRQIAELEARLAALKAAQAADDDGAPPVVSSEQQAAPRSETKVALIVGGVLLLLLVASLLSYCGHLAGDNATAAGNAAPAGATDANSALAAANAAMAASNAADNAAVAANAAMAGGAQAGGAAADQGGSAWTYHESLDNLRNLPSYLSCTTSTAEVSLSAPYTSQYPTLCIRKHPRFGLDAMLRLPDGGQFSCTSYDGCSVQVRFDDGSVQRFSAVTASDGSDDVLFIRPPARFVAGVRRARQVIVEAEFYQAGNQQMVFPIAGLDAAKAGLGG